MNKILLCCCLLASVIITAQNKSVLIESDSKDTIEDTIVKGQFKLFKKNAQASYYSGKFNGRRMANGDRFDDSKLTAAHKKIPFGTKLKITNEMNDKFVIVEVTDRGPFVKGREIDLSKRAFMDIVSNKRCGAIYVKIEILKK